MTGKHSESFQDMEAAGTAQMQTLRKEGSRAAFPSHTLRCSFQGARPSKTAGFCYPQWAKRLQLTMQVLPGAAGRKRRKREEEGRGEEREGRGRRPVGRGCTSLSLAPLLCTMEGTLPWGSASRLKTVNHAESPPKQLSLNTCLRKPVSERQHHGPDGDQEL